jgi:hypothetical protein
MVKFYLNPRPKSKNSAFDPQKRKYYSNNIEFIKEKLWLL